MQLTFDSATDLARALRRAADAHAQHEEQTGHPDPDWPSWYADWLVGLSELPDLLGAKPVRSHLVHALVQLDRDYNAAAPAGPWEPWYAERLPALVSA